MSRHRMSNTQMYSIPTACTRSTSTRFCNHTRPMDFTMPALPLIPRSQTSKHTRRYINLISYATTRCHRSHQPHTMWAILRLIKPPDASAAIRSITCSQNYLL